MYHGEPWNPVASSQQRDKTGDKNGQGQVKIVILSGRINLAHHPEVMLLGTGLLLHRVAKHQVHQGPTGRIRTLAADPLTLHKLAQLNGWVGFP